MISIDRSKEPLPALLDPDDEHSTGAKETKKFIAHIVDPTKPKPEIAAYSKDPVKKALYRLFAMKCAYCEKKVDDARDIEHFRPKNAIDPGNGLPKIKPGYYWLAARWENLLLSCPQCNQRNRKLFLDDDGGWEFEEDSTGKLDQFPLTDEEERVKTHTGDIADEEPYRLLLNPCIDPVKKHLRFDEEGLIIARQIQGQISEMAKVSIMVYALDRPLLNDKRKQTWLAVEKLRADIEFIGQMIANATDGDLLRTRLNAKGADLNDMLKPTAEFSAMTNHLAKKKKVRRVLNRVRAELDAKFPLI